MSNIEKSHHSGASQLLAGGGDLIAVPLPGGERGGAQLQDAVPKRRLPETRERLTLKPSFSSVHLTALAAGGSRQERSSL